MLELLAFGLMVTVGLVLLVLLPLLLVGAVLKLVLGLVLLPFKLLGALLHAVGAVLGGLFKGLFAVGAVLVCIVAVPLLVLALPVGLLLLGVLAVAAA
jgi:hypothetical protein